MCNILSKLDFINKCKIILHTGDLLILFSALKLLFVSSTSDLRNINREKVSFMGSNNMKTRFLGNQREHQKENEKPTMNYDYVIFSIQLLLHNTQFLVLHVNCFLCVWQIIARATAINRMWLVRAQQESAVHAEKFLQWYGSFRQTVRSTVDRFSGQ